MTKMKMYCVYCDESCHLEHDRIPVMAWGSIYCETHIVPEISERVRALKAEHGLKPGFEAKWTKVSPAKVDFYLSLIDLFLEDQRLNFRGLVVPDKGLLNHAAFDQSHDDWYYKYYKRWSAVWRAPRQMSSPSGIGKQMGIVLASGAGRPCRGRSLAGPAPLRADSLGALGDRECAAE